MDNAPQIMAVSLAIGLAAGVIMHRADYCLVCPFRDIFLFKNGYMFRIYLLLVVCSMVLFETARICGLLPFYPFPLLGNPTLAHLIGGALFGLGMVMAGGCVVGTLYKMGSGHLLSLFAFAGIIAGSALYAEFHPFWAAFAKSSALFGGAATIPRWLGIGPGPFVWVTAACTLPLFLKWRRTGKWVRPHRPTGYLQPWAAAMLLSCLGALSWVWVGMPIGVTTSYAKMAGYLESLVAPKHLETLAYFKVVSLRVRDPFTGCLLSGGPGPVFDGIAAIQFPLIVGVVAGSALSAVSVGELKFRGTLPSVQLALAICGGLLMGLASRMAFGCNVWHLLGGIPILGLSSLLFGVGLLPGSWLGCRILERSLL